MIFEWKSNYNGELKAKAVLTLWDIINILTEDDSEVFIHYEWVDSKNHDRVKLVHIGKMFKCKFSVEEWSNALEVLHMGWVHSIDAFVIYLKETNHPIHDYITELELDETDGVLVWEG